MDLKEMLDPGGYIFKKEKPAPTPDMALGYYGGSKAASEAYGDQYAAGVESGQAQIGQGFATLDQAGQGFAGVGSTAAQATSRGLGTYDAGMQQNAMTQFYQRRALEMQQAAARGEAPSAAQQMLRVNADNAARQQMSIAAGARGGNQAAAMANAQATGAQMALQAGQQASILRAQEMAQARDAYGGMANAIRGQDLSQANIGTSFFGQGLGGQVGSAQGLLSIGGSQANIGQNREANYLTLDQGRVQSEQSARIGQDLARMGATQQQRAQDAAQQGQLLGTAGAVAGTVYGGPAGGAAGKKVGEQAGQSS